MTKEKKVKQSSKVTSINKAPAKKLTQSALNKLASDFNEKGKVTITVNDEQFEVVISKKFRETAIRKIYVEYLLFLNQLRQMDDIDGEALLNATYVFNALILKEFTNLPIPDVNDVGKLVKVTLNLVDLGIMEQLLGENSPFGEENIELLNRVLKSAGEGVGKALSELGIAAEINEAEKDRIDVDDYFATLGAKNFEITDDEDLTLLPQVIDQLNEEGKLDEYMNKLTDEEIKKLYERLDILDKQSSDRDEEVQEH